jgi:hypothetical protein
MGGYVWRSPEQEPFPELHPGTFDPCLVNRHLTFSFAFFVALDDICRLWYFVTTNIVIS